MPRPQPIFRALWDEVEDTKEMFRTFNMGVGMILVVSADVADEAKAKLEKMVDYKVWEVGEVTEGEKKVEIG